MNLSTTQYTTILLAVLLWSMTSCVGKKKFNEMESTKNSMENTLYETRKDLAHTKKDLMIAEDSIQLLNGALDQTSNELVSTQAALDQARADLRYANMGQEEMTAALKACEEEAAALKATLEEQKARTKALRESILKALAGLEAADLQVEERNGRVHVVLSQKLLFTTGSISVNQGGRSAIVSLAKVLTQNKDLDILVEGHTDSDGPEDINWNLSMGRAMAISNILIKNGVNPERITAAGRGEHAPIAPNDTAENKAKNRRTEIILSPKLGTLYELLQAE